MKYIFLLSLYLISFSLSALPTLFVGETARITKDDVEYPLYGTRGTYRIRCSTNG